MQALVDRNSEATDTGGLVSLSTVANKATNGAFPLHGLARPRLAAIGLVRTSSLYGAFPLQFRNWGSIYSNAV